MTGDERSGMPPFCCFPSSIASLVTQLEMISRLGPSQPVFTPEMALRVFQELLRPSDMRLLEGVLLLFSSSL